MKSVSSFLRIASCLAVVAGDLSRCGALEGLGWGWGSQDEEKPSLKSERLERFFLNHSDHPPLTTDTTNTNYHKGLSDFDSY